MSFLLFQLATFTLLGSFFIAMFLKLSGMVQFESAFSWRIIKFPLLVKVVFAPLFWLFLIAAAVVYGAFFYSLFVGR